MPASQVDRESLTLGYASPRIVLLHARRQPKYGIPPTDPVGAGRRGMVGGQEDMIVDVALDLLNLAKTA